MQNSNSRIILTMFAKKLIKYCSIFYRIRKIFHRKHLLQFYNAFVKTKNQYGILVYGCCKHTSLKPIFMLQKRIIKTIFSKRKYDHISKEMIEKKLQMFMNSIVMSVLNKLSVIQNIQIQI